MRHRKTWAQGGNNAKRVRPVVQRDRPVVQKHRPVVQRHRPKHQMGQHSAHHPVCGRHFVLCGCSDSSGGGSGSGRRTASDLG